MKYLILDGTKGGNFFAPLPEQTETNQVKISHNFQAGIPMLLSLANFSPIMGALFLPFKKSMSLNETINALDRVSSETDANDWIDQIRWLNDWK